MLDNLIRGFEQGRGHNGIRSRGFGFEEQKGFVTRMESEGGHFDRQAHYEHHMRLPANHGRPPMAHMTVWEEEDDDSDVELFESSRSHHTDALLHHNNNHHQQSPHLKFMAPPPVAQPHHNGKMVGNGWQGRHEDAYHSGLGMQQNHSRYEMQQHQDGYDMQKNQGGYEMQQHQGGHDMEKYHGGYEMQQHQGGHGMQQNHGGNQMQKHPGGYGMQHQDRLMTPQAPPSHVYMNPIHSSGDGRAGVFKTTEKWQARGGNRQLGWGSKGL